jgi:hypothetical protein
LVLSTGEDYYGCFNLLELFNKSRGLLRHIWGELPIGHYILDASYQGISASPQIGFDIVVPTDQETAPYQLLQDAFSAMRQDESDVQARKLRELIEKFPGSVYVEKALRELFEDKELLRRFPNSGYTERSLMALTRELDPQSKETFLEEVIRTQSGSRSAKLAEQMLKWSTN